MAVTTGTRKRTQPSTHPSVFVGLLMAIGGLLLAMYAYTGTRIYDRTFAYVAIGGGILALSGILVSAWGRAIMASRAQRARRVAVRENAQQQDQKLEEKPARRGFSLGRKRAAEARAPPTIAAPADKKRALMPTLPKLGRRGKAKPENGANGAPSFFAFKRKNEGASSSGGASSSVVTEEQPADTDPTADGAIVRITLRCPECNEQFTAEGVQPLTVTCPACSFSGTV